MQQTFNCFKCGTINYGGQIYCVYCGQVFQHTSQNYNYTTNQELLDKARTVAFYLYFFSSQYAKSAGEETLLRPHLGEHLRSYMNALNIQVLSREFPNLYGIRQGLVFSVFDKGVIQLQFAYSLGEAAEENSTNLESVNIYRQGKWEQGLDFVYRKCMELLSQWNEICTLMEKATPDDMDMIIKLIESTQNPAQTIELLVYALSSENEDGCYPLYMALVSAGKVKESQLVNKTLIQIYPDKAMYYLSYGHMFFDAVYNSKGIIGDPTERLRRMIKLEPKLWAPTLKTWKKTDPSLYRALTDSRYESKIDNYFENLISVITLEALGCDYGYALIVAEGYYIKAEQLAKDKKTKEQAREALKRLKIVDKIRPT